jgi:hypothetical protein
MRKVRALAARWVVLIGLTVPGTGWAQTATLARQADWIERAVDREVSRLSLSGLVGDPVFRVARQSRAPKRSWIGRHPALFGALVGFGGGFLIGFLPGDDAVFDDSDASFNGLVLGGVGALTGAIVGEVTK